MSKLTEFINDFLVWPSWDRWEVVEPNVEQLHELKKLVEARLDVLYFPHMYNINEERK